MAKPYPFFALIIFFFFPISLIAQCTANSGNPIVNVTFGSGTSTLGPALANGITSFQNVTTTCPNDGQYTIANYTTGCWGSGWHTTTDHTGNTNGYFMIINATIDPSDFYVQTVNNLCDGTTYNFSAWVMNLIVSGGILPNITFTVEKTDGTVLGSYSTGGIPVINPATWKQYGFSFTTPTGINTVVIRMHNNAPGGVGNDLALDDITFTPTGPPTSIAIQGYGSGNITVCNPSLQLYSTVGSCYLNNAYQWQSSHDGISWTDITGANAATFLLSGLSAGTYYYRLTVAQVGNIGNSNCRINSNTVSVNVTKGSPILASKQAVICSGSVYTFPSGTTVSAPGTYYDTIRYAGNGCDSLITTVDLQVSQPIKIQLNASICQGDIYVLPSGKNVSVSGIYTDTIRFTNGGCDSLITTLNLNITQVKKGNLDTTICKGSQYALPSGKRINMSGLYNDTVRNAIGCDSIIYILKLKVDTVPTQSLQTITICKDSSASIGLVNGFLNYLWSTGATTSSITVSVDGIYILKLTDSNSCADTDTFKVNVSVPSVNLGKSAVLCNGNTIILDAGIGFFSYLWNTGEVTETIAIATSGKYWVMVTDENLCTANDSISVNDVQLPVNFLPSDTSKCSYATIVLKPASNYDSYLWNTGATTSSIEIKTPGSYWLEVTDSNQCKGKETIVVTDSVCPEAIYVPNAFTPNGDGKNDVFKPIIWGNATSYKFEIFNRWGQKIFESSVVGVGWDGIVNGVQQQTGVFIWYLSVSLGQGAPTVKNGDFTLIR